ncbi:MAG: hypothetical protein RIT43_530 [Bacteroidota bacterium]
MNEQENQAKKKSIIKRILIWSASGLTLILISLLLVPILFKDELKQMALDEVNKSLNAKVSLGDFDVTFIRTFPNMTIELTDAKITGKGKFKDVDLANIKRFSAQVGFWSVISGDQVEIDEIHLEEPSFDVRILNDGTANYDIVKPDSVKTPEEKAEPSNFKLSLKEYSISGANIRYDDQASDMFADLKNMNHTGKGDLTADVIDFETETSIEELSYEMDGISYLSKVKTNAIVNLLMEFTEKTSKFSMKENEFKLNALTFSVDGFYEMLEGYDTMNLKLDASKATFKDFLSLIPTFYQSGYESMVTKGNLAMNGLVKGKMDDKNMPGWDFNLKVDNASIKYPDLPGTISNIIVKAGSKFQGGADMDKMTLDVEKFHADFVGNTIDANLKMRNPMTDPLLISKIQAKMDLATLKKVIPMEEGESYNGKMNADVNINGRMSSLDKGDYEAFKAEGTIELMDMIYESSGLNEDVSIQAMLFRFSPKNLNLEQLTAKAGKSDFSMSGTVDNYMGYVFRDELLHGAFNFNSTYLDMDQLMNLVPVEENTTAEAATAEENTPESTEPTLIPDNVDFTLNTGINTLRYNGMDIKNVKGTVKLKEEVASLDNLTMNTMGGTVGLKGSYSTKDHNKPKVDFAYSLKDIEIKQLADNFLTIEKLAPIAKYATGKISSNFEMKSDLKPNLEPIYESLSGLGDLSTSTLTVSGFKPLEKMGEALNINKLSSQTVKDIKARFQFSDGKVTVKPFDIQLGKIKTNISGFTGFDQKISYDLKMMIPKEEIPATMIKAAEQAIAKVNNLAPKLSLNSIPDVLPIKVGLGGTVTDPKVTNNFKEALLEATGNLKDQMVDKVKDAVKDTVKAIVDDKVKEVKEDLNAKKQEILDDAQKQADKVKAEAKKAADAVRAQAKKEADRLMQEAGSNPLKQQGAKIAGDKLKKEAEEKAQKIEKEGNQKADQIMAEARKKADAIK